MYAPKRRHLHWQNYFLSPFLANSKHKIPTHKSSVTVKPIFASFNFAVLFSSRNKRHVNIKGFTVKEKAGVVLTNFWTLNMAKIEY